MRRDDADRTPLPAKLTRPQAHAFVPRAHLFRRLDVPGNRRWSWVSAPAGAGKTTLASSWIETSGSECLWLSIDAGDADPATMFHYLGLAGKRRAGRRRAHLPPLTPEFVPGLDVFARRFFEQLFALYTQPFAIVLDNCHEVPTDAALMQVVLDALLDSLPAHGYLVCLSRQQLPATLARWSAEPGFVGLGWEDLSFTDEEATALARLARPQAVPGIVACNQRLRGWVAGLKLLLRTAPEEINRLAVGAAHSGQELFNYFAQEVFEHSTPERRDFLLRAAVLPDMEEETAAAVSGRPEAGALLAELYAERLFIERRRLGERLSYRFHPLFRDFLRARLLRERGQMEAVSLGILAAGLLQTRGEMEAATQIALDCGDADLLVRLILQQAQLLFEQGRLIILEQWIGAVPAPQRSMNGWLLYWLGVSLSLRDPARGRTELERAYQRFEESGEKIGAWMAVAAVIHAYFVVWGTEIEHVERWIGIFQSLQTQNGGRLPESIELQVIALLGHFASHRPEHAVSRYLAERSRILAPRLSDPVQRCAIGSIALGFLTWQGDERAAWGLIEELRRSRDEDAAITLATLVFDIWHGILLWTGGDYERSFELLDERRRRCRNSGLQMWEWHCATHMMIAALGMGDMARASQSLQETLRSLTPQHIFISYLVRAHQALCLAFAGDLTAATQLARAWYADRSILGGATSTLAYLECMVGSVLLDAGKLDEAADCARSALEHASRLPSDRFTFDAEMLFAGIELERDALEAVLRRLRSALAIAARRGLKGGLSLLQRVRAARLLALALGHGIEVEQSRRIIRACKLPAPDDVMLAAHWPVRVRIGALGGFSLEIDGRSLTHSQRVARKPLEVLKVLIGLGPAEVGFDALQAALWPELEGDAARNAAHVAIHRLRKFLGDEGIIVVDQAAVSLDPTRTWVDVEAFRGLSGHLQAALRAGIRSRPQAEHAALELVRAYAGHFLPAVEQPWTVAVRERLRSRFVSVATALSETLERLGANDGALALHRHGIDLDPHNETFHQGMIRNLVALGRTAEALEAYQRCRSLLRAGLGVAPSAETERLIRSVRGGRVPVP